MNPNPSPDELDRFLSGYFKSQMQRPWPTAPVPAQAEPAELLAVRNTTTATTPDHSSRSRLTLAASVAVLLGSCWVMSNGLDLGHRPAGGKPGPDAAPGAFPGGSANEPAILPKIKEIRATQPDPADMPMPPIKDAFGKQP